MNDAQAVRPDDAHVAPAQTPESRCSSARPSAPSSEKPAEMTMAAGTPRSTHCSISAGHGGRRRGDDGEIDGFGYVGKGRIAEDAMHGVAFRIDRDRPRRRRGCSRLCIRMLPTLPGVALAPTTATDVGWNSGSSAMSDRHGVIAPSGAAGHGSHVANLADIRTAAAHAAHGHVRVRQPHAVAVLHLPRHPLDGSTQYHAAPAPRANCGPR